MRVIGPEFVHEASRGRCGKVYNACAEEKFGIGSAKILLEERTLKPLKSLKAFTSLIILIVLAACGRNFKTLDVNTIKALEDTNSKGAPAESGDSEAKKEPITAVSEIWMQDIPNKYDDVGDFFRIKQVPGLGQDKILDTVQIKNEKERKILKLVRGHLRLSNVSHHFNSPTNQLEVKGDVVFNDGKPLSFVLTGAADSDEISLSIANIKSSLKDVFRAKAICSSGEAEDVKKDSADYCRQLTIDFYYRDKDTFYTDQLISKDILYKEIKRQENPLDIVPDTIFENTPDEDLSDYERNQKKGIGDDGGFGLQGDELPYYYVEPSVDDLAKLYPDVSRNIEAQKDAFFKTKKKIRDVPQLTGDETIPEKDVNLKTPPAGVPVVPSVPLLPEGKPSTPPTSGQQQPPAASPKDQTAVSPAKPPTEVTPIAPTKPPPVTTPIMPPAKPVTPAPTQKPPVGTPPLSPPPRSDTKPPLVVAPPSAPQTKPPVTTSDKTDPAKPQVKPIEKPVVPAKTPVPPPVKPEAPKATPTPRASVSRPIDQAVGKAMGAGSRLLNANSLLEAAQKLGNSAGFEILWPSKKRHYATYDIVDLVVNLGAWLRENLPGIPLSIGDVSAFSGGRIGSHGSHRTGMDIDLAYLTDNRRLVMDRMDIPNKSGYTHSDFLAADQWKLMKTAHEVAPIEVIYVNRNIKNEMCKQALKSGDLKSKTDTSSLAAAILTKMIVEDSAHGNHWHVRLDCRTLKDLRLQRKCVVHPQAYVGPECRNVKL